MAPRRLMTAIAMVAVIGTGWSNGADFPDPGADGTIQYYGASPELTSASEKCDDLLPEDRNR